MMPKLPNETFEVGPGGEIIARSEPERIYQFDAWQLGELIETMALRSQIETPLHQAPTVRIELPIADALTLAKVLKSVPRIT
jgi:hypothetical protein